MFRDHVVQVGNDFVNFEYHIAYSTSYCVPVLYFRACYNDGKFVRLDKTLDSNEVTQAEHPVLGTPFFFIHPCETKSMLKVLDTKENVLIFSWLSWISKPLSFRVDYENYKELREVAVSVVIPCFNCEHFLEDLVSSIASQTWPGDRKEIQLVFFDDHSADGTFAKLSELCDAKLQDFVVTLLRNQEKVNRGSGYARNRCIERSVGKFLAFLDSDDVMHKDRLFKQYVAAKEHPNAIVSCKMNCFPRKMPFYEWINTLTKQEDLIAFRFREITTPLPTWFFSRKVWDSIGYMEEQKDYPEDLQFFLTHLQQNGSLFKIDQVLLDYRIHENQGRHFRSSHFILKSFSIKKNA